MADKPTSSTPAKAKPLKIRSGVVRKTKAERDEFEKQEEQRRTARLVAAAGANVATTGTGSQNKKSERKTRDTKAKDGHVPSGSASGVFGSGSGGRHTARRVQDGGKSEMLEGQEAMVPVDEVKAPAAQSGTRPGNNDAAGGGSSGGGGGSGSHRVGASISEAIEDLDYTIDLEADDEPTRDIEEIEDSSDEMTESPDDEQVTSSVRKGKLERHTVKPVGRGTALRPVRAARELEDYDDEDEETTVRRRRRRRKSKRNLPDDDDELEDDDGQAHVHDTTVKQDIPSSPELGRKKTARRTTTKQRDPKATFETAEERAERLRMEKDILKIKREFATAPKMPAPAQADADDDEIMYDQGQKFFLFQFPPLVPRLQDVEHLPAPDSPKITIKRESDVPNAPNQTDQTGQTNGQSTGTTQPSGIFTADESVRMPSGCIGKLRVHKSGKVSLDWGGTDMELRYGTEVDFLQDVVLIEPPPPPPETDIETSYNTKRPVGAAYALGHVHRKLIAVPDWQKLYD